MDRPLTTTPVESFGLELRHDGHAFALVLTGGGEALPLATAPTAAAAWQRGHTALWRLTMAASRQAAAYDVPGRRPHFCMAQGHQARACELSGTCQREIACNH